MKKFRCELGPISALIFRLALIYVLYFMLRVIFLLYNADFFEGVSSQEYWVMFSAALKFDTSGIIYTNILFIVLALLPFHFTSHKGYQTMLNTLYLITNSVAIILNMGDAVYYRFTLRRTTMDVFQEFGGEDNGLAMMGKFVLDFWPITLITLALIALLIWGSRFIKVHPVKLYKPWLFYTGRVLILVLGMALCVGGMRGGFDHSIRPITASNASVYVNKSNHRALVLNTPFTLIRSFGKQVVPIEQYFSDEEALRYFNPIKNCALDTNAYFGTCKGKNIMVLIWESGAREFTGFFNRKVPGYESYTPFLDSLAQHSITFDRAYANGRKSIDAMPSILASVPRVGVCFVLSKYSNNWVNTPANLLKSQGYHSLFTHGAPNGSMGFDSFVKHAGYESYYGKDEFNDNSLYDGAWGIWDEPFLSYTADVLDTISKPFVDATFTVSSHHPFHVPPQYEGRFPMGHIPYHQVIGYTDYAIKKFFEKAKTRSWFDQTIFVIMADHSTPHYEESYKNVLGDYAIPMVIYIPGSGLQMTDTTTVVEQCDVLPTLMNLVGYDKDFVSFGNDMLDPKVRHTAFFYSGDFYHLVEGDYVLAFDTKKVVAFYNSRLDPQLQHNLVSEPSPIKDKMEQEIKARIQGYTKGLNENKLSLVREN